MAFRYTVSLAQDNDAQLVVCHSIPDFSQAMSYLQGNYSETVQEALSSNAKEKLDNFVEKVDSVRVIKIIGEGNPAEVILQTARRTASDLIVMGTHGLSGHEEFFTGSVTNKVLHKSALPVLTVCRPTHHFIKDDDLRPVQIKKVLCAVDYDSNSRHVAKLAFQITRMYNAEITIFHSVPKVHVHEWHEQQRWVKDKLMEFVSPSEEDWCSAKFLVVSVSPAEKILEIVRTDQIDLVVLGHHSRKLSEELCLGSVAKRVVTDSICPVLVARSREDVAIKELTL